MMMMTMMMMMMMMMMVQAAWAGATTAMAAITVTGEATEDRDPALSQLEVGVIVPRASNEGSDRVDSQSRRRVLSWLKTLILIRHYAKWVPQHGRREIGTPSRRLHSSSGLLRDCEIFV